LATKILKSNLKKSIVKKIIGHFKFFFGGEGGRNLTLFHLLDLALVIFVISWYYFFMMNDRELIN